MRSTRPGRARPARRSTISGSLLLVLLLLALGCSPRFAGEVPGVTFLTPWLVQVGDGIAVVQADGEPVWDRIPERDWIALLDPATGSWIEGPPGGDRHGLELARITIGVPHRLELLRQGRRQPLLAVKPRVGYLCGNVDSADLCVASDGVVVHLVYSGYGNREGLEVEHSYRFNDSGDPETILATFRRVLYDGLPEWW
jgi:hypothetical protein